MSKEEQKLIKLIQSGDKAKIKTAFMHNLYAA